MLVLLTHFCIFNITYLNKIENKNHPVKMWSNVVRFQKFLWVFNLGVVIWHPLSWDLASMTPFVFLKREHNEDTFKWRIHHTAHKLFHDTKNLSYFCCLDETTYNKNWNNFDRPYLRCHEIILKHYVRSSI